MSSSIFHNGELSVQRLAGESLIAERNCSMVQPRLNMGMETYINGLSVIFVSSMDSSGGLWASVISGKPGFCESTNSSQLMIKKKLLQSDPDDIFWKNLLVNAQVGMLFIDLETRRRLRINGKTSVSENNLSVEIIQSFPNCPKYIQRRKIFSNVPVSEPLSDNLSQWVANSDTCFVASASSERALDVSHRGGATGFILMESENVLVIPDYVGNSMFNTLGNFYVNPSAGILFLDFRNGNTLQLSGVAELHLEDDSESPFGEAVSRFWKFHVKKKIFKNSLTGISFGFLDYSPFNP